MLVIGILLEYELNAVVTHPGDDSSPAVRSPVAVSLPCYFRKLTSNASPQATMFRRDSLASQIT